uniref:TM2 domain containing 3 n=1 Tax=Cyprinus carpio TaxID=7962 RepID=A0A8C1UHG0_CYPCA
MCELYYVAVASYVYYYIFIKTLSSFQRRFGHNSFSLIKAKHFYFELSAVGTFTQAEAGSESLFWMLANGLKWVFERERNTMSSYLMLFLLLLDIYSRCVIAYLSSPHVGQEPAYTAQQSPVMSSPLALTASSAAPAVTDSYLSRCPSGGLCSRLPADCIICAFHHNCIYGRPASFTCRAKAGVHCVSDQSQPQQNFSLTLDCRFCWQLDPSQYRCSNSTSCMTVSCPRRLYNATCEALEHVHCLGTHTHTDTHTHTQIHTHTHTHTDTHTHTHTQTDIHTHRYTHTHTHKQIHTHTLSHAHTHIHTHRYTHTHTHTNR